MDYDLHRLGPLLFEQLVQALVVAEYPGKVVQIFGRGPDGGRDATIQGFDFVSRQGQAVTTTAIVQAKFVDVPASQAAEGWKRFKATLKPELRRWREISGASTPGAVEKPGFMLFATNASLSAVRDQGGIDKFAELLEAASEYDFAVEGDVWHYARICALLDVHHGVRTTYLPAILTGDVLAQVMRGLEREDQTEAQILGATLASELGEDRQMSSSELGDIEDREPRLGDIFVDVVYKTQGVTSHDRVVASLVAQLDRMTRPRDPSRLPPTRIALVGGPGQGKTTTSRFLAQLYRRAILNSSEVFVHERILPVLQETSDAIAANDLPEPRVRRWPLRVVLGEYAKTIAAGVETEPLSLSNYIEQQVNLYSEVPLAPGALSRWMQHWPILMILDGMDETPVDLRPAILRQIARFEDHANEINADLAILVTTRPQGDRTDLDPARYSHWVLGKLSGPDARAYATKLLELRFGEAPRTLARVKERLEGAMVTEGTRKLFSTPLQVSILTILLEKKERLPLSRFGLFNAYFNAMYGREESKPGAVGQFLQRERVLIEEVHQRAGLLMQIRGEKSTDGRVLLSDDELKSLVRGSLVAAGARENLQERVKSLVAATVDRLVLLVASEEGHWEFEVKSLQEYMAAQALTSGHIKSKLGRAVLAETASSTYWRNVWLLAAGSAFTLTHSNRDRIMRILSSMNTLSPLMHIALPSSALAVDMLADEVATSHPGDQRELVLHALAGRRNATASAMDLLAATISDIQSDAETRNFLQLELASIGATNEGLSSILPIVRRLADESGALRSFARELDARAEAEDLVFIPVSDSGSLDRLAGLVSRARKARDLNDLEVSTTDLLDSLIESVRPSSSSATELLTLTGFAGLLDNASFADGFTSLVAKLQTSPDDMRGMPGIARGAEELRDRSARVRSLAGKFVLHDE